MRAAVLFELDDTLFDHQFARRAALQKLTTEFSPLSGRALAEIDSLERTGPLEKLLLG